jgi:hypothetical protein
MHEAWALSIAIVLFYMVPSPHNDLDLVHEICRAGRDGKKYVAIVLYNTSRWAWSKSCCDIYRLHMLNVFLRESDLQQEPSKTHNVFYVCARKSFPFKQIINGRYWRKWLWCNGSIGSVRLLRWNQHDGLNAL